MTFNKRLNKLLKEGMSTGTDPVATGKRVGQKFKKSNNTLDQVDRIANKVAIKSKKAGTKDKFYDSVLKGALKGIKESNRGAKKLSRIGKSIAKAIVSGNKDKVTKLDKVYDKKNVQWQTPHDPRLEKRLHKAQNFKKI